MGCSADLRARDKPYVPTPFSPSVLSERCSLVLSPAFRSSLMLCSAHVFSNDHGSKGQTHSSMLMCIGHSIDSSHTEPWATGSANGLRTFDEFVTTATMVQPQSGARAVSLSPFMNCWETQRFETAIVPTISALASCRVGRACSWCAVMSSHLGACVLTPCANWSATSSIILNG